MQATGPNQQPNGNGRLDPQAEYFDAFAASYEQEAAKVAWRERASEQIAKAIELKGPADIKQVADLGGGVGISAQAILDHCAPDHLLVVDFSPKSLDELRRRQISEAIKAKRADIREFVAEADEDFDLVTIFGTIEFLPPADQLELIQNLPRVLKENGYVAFSLVPKTGEADQAVNYAKSFDKSSTEYFVAPNEVIRTIGEAGLTLDSYFEFDMYELEDRTVKYGFVIAHKPATEEL